MRREPGLKEDAQNLSLIAGSAIVAALITAGLLSASAAPEPLRIDVRVMQPPPVDAPVAHPEPIEHRYRIVTPLSGSNRLYGTIHTTSGATATGYIRWDRNEGSWADLLDANKPRGAGESISGIRFGHVSRMQVRGRNAALLTLKSGEQVELTSNATDLGSALRALVVEHANGQVAELDWDQLDEVEFLPVPEAAPAPSQGRLFGTVTTRSGMEFTGYVTWDVDEIYSSDVLDGDLHGRRLEIPFGAVASIERHSSWGARVTLHDGEEMILEGTNDVDDSMRGVSVSDPMLGQVLLDWDEFRSVRFHGAEAESSFDQFDGGRRIEGTVVTRSGRELGGRIVWDDDETYTWEMLNGEIRGVELNVEFGNIARIVKTARGADVTLLDGRTLVLANSNDVDDGNRGIFVEAEGATVEIDWEDFAELRLSH